MNTSDKEFWEERYDEQNTGWDLGQCSPPLRDWFDREENKQLNILIPGAGNAYEAEYLYKSGFTNVVVLDFAETPILNFRKRVIDFPQEQLILQDFFEHERKYDRIVEQTFFCAIPPDYRERYVKKIKELLVPGGKLIGVLFDRDFPAGPPFGGSAVEYKQLFETHFSSVKIYPCLHSVTPRMGTEVFIEIEK